MVKSCKMKRKKRRKSPRVRGSVVIFQLQTELTLH